MMIIDLLKIVIPSLLVLLASYLVLRKLLKEETGQRKAELALNNQRITLPVRLQAYERLVLYLERISPESLLLRMNQPGLSAQQLQASLNANIRAEWEHNISQQLYVSTRAWELVKNAKANVIKLITLCAERVEPEAPSIRLSQLILDKVVEAETHPTAVAVEFLKREVSELF